MDLTVGQADLKSDTPILAKIMAYFLTCWSFGGIYVGNYVLIE